MDAWPPTTVAHAVTLGAAALSLATAGVLAHGTFAPRSCLFGEVVSRGRAKSGTVALTFDDGPLPGATEAVLDVLAREQVRATFFVIGRYAAEHPSLIRQIHAAGHLLGNHTYDHARSGMFRGPRYWTEQIQRTNDVLRGLTGETPRYFRPPMGFKSPLVMRGVVATRSQMVTWSRRGFDGVKTTPRTIVGHLARAGAGDILLLHDGRDPASRRVLGATAEALPEVIASIRSRGLKMVRLDELLGVQNQASGERV